MVYNVKCCVSGCTSRGWAENSDVKATHFFRFPKKDTPRFRIWMTSVVPSCAENRTGSLRICGLHFTDNQFRNTSFQNLNSTAVPSLCLPDMDDNIIISQCVVKEEKVDMEEYLESTIKQEVCDEEMSEKVIQSERIGDVIVSSLPEIKEENVQDEDYNWKRNEDFSENEGDVLDGPSEI